MSPTKKSRFDDGTELEVIIPAYFCPVVSRVVVLSITVVIVHSLYGLFGNGFVAFFILTKINYVGSGASSLCHHFMLLEIRGPKS